MAINDPTQHFYTPAAELSSIASQVLNKDATCFGDLSVKKIGRSFGAETFGVFRVAGRAHTSAGEEQWSAVAKIMTVPETSSPGRRIEGASREIEVYRSGVFDQLCGGVRSAKCYAIQFFRRHTISVVGRFISRVPATLGSNSVHPGCAQLRTI